MFANYTQIKRRIDYIEDELKRIENMEREWPSGELICAKNNKKYKWYLRSENQSIYLPKKEKQLAQKLAAKKYYQLRKKDLQRELSACRMYLGRADNSQSAIERMMQNAEYERLLGRHFNSMDTELAQWTNAEYERNGSHAENLIVQGTGGKFVRSKSEAIIDRTLYYFGVPFRYEDKLILGNSIFYPDFTIRHPKTGRFFYWEHFGIMDNPEYANRACQKIKSYCECGIIPSVNLILTYETKEYPLAIERVERLVKEYFL